jgi:hypothetical protein
MHRPNSAVSLHKASSAKTLLHLKHSSDQVPRKDKQGIVNKQQFVNKALVLNLKSTINVLKEANSIFTQNKTKPQSQPIEIETLPEPTTPNCASPKAKERGESK